MPIDCTTKLKVTAIHSFFEDENTESSDQIESYWMNLDATKSVKVRITEQSITTSETISNTGDRSFQMLEEGEEGDLECQNIFTESWDGNNSTVTFKMEHLED